MSSEDSHMAERVARAKKISASPKKFKICEGCESIVSMKAITCPNCHGYRFDESPEAVKRQAKALASRPQQSITSNDLF